MSAIRALANQAWRDYWIDGEASSGVHDVDKSQVRALFALLETLTNLTVISASVDAQPNDPEVGDAYIMTGAAAGAAWGSYTAGNVAVYLASGWLQVTPKPGMMAFIQDVQVHRYREGASWVDVVGGSGESAIIVRAATTANITLSGEQTIDGVALSEGELVLVKDQSSAAANGVYAVSAGAWERTASFNAWAEIPGAIITVQQGATHADSAWQSSADAGGELDVTAIPFVQVSSGSINSVRWGYLAAATAYGGPLMAAADLADLVAKLGGAGDVRTALSLYSQAEVDALIAGVESGGGEEAVADHVGEADPHGQYKLESEISANGATLINHTFAQMRADLDLEIGTDVQAYSANLTAFAGVSPGANVLSLLGAANYAAMRGLLDLEVGVDFYSIGAVDSALAGKQAASANLTTWATIAPSANVQALNGAANYAAIRALLDLEPGTDFYAVSAADALLAGKQAASANLTTWAGIAPSANVQSFAAAGDYAAMRTLLGLVIGANVQAFSANLSTFAGIAPHANAQTLLGHTFAQMRADLDLEAGTDFYSMTGADAQFLAKSGGTLTGPVTLHADPSSALHAATKQYVDNLAAGFDVKPSVRAATTANISLSGAQTIDGVSIIAGDRVLVKNQSAAAENGIYVAASGSWARAADMDAWSETPGANVWVEEGTANGDRAFVCTANAGGTLGTTAISWTQFGGTGAYQAKSSVLDAYAALSSPSANVQTILQAADYAAIRTALGLVIGTNVQAYSANLATFAAIAPAANVQSLLSAANYAAMRALLDLEAGTDFYSITAADAQFQAKSYAVDNPGTTALSSAVAVARTDATRWAQRIAIAGKDFGLVVDGSTSQSARLQELMERLDERGGGILQLPPTGASAIAINTGLDNIYDNVLVQGAGRGENHDVGVPKWGTALLCTAAITALKHRSPSGNATTRRKQGGGFENFSVLSGNLMTRALQVTSRLFGTYKIYIQNCEGAEAVLFDSLVSGTDLGEAGDNQSFYLDVVMRLLDTAAALACRGVVFAGASNANTSINRRGIHINGSHGSADLVYFQNADNLFVDTIRSASVSTGKPFRVAGSKLEVGKYTEGLVIGFLTATNAGYVEGTGDTDVTTAARIRIDQLDDSNGTPRPTGGTGAQIMVMDSWGRGVGWCLEKLGVGETMGNAALARAAAEAVSGSLYVYNTSEQHQYISDGTNIWCLRIASGNLTPSRLAGSGKLSLPAVTELLVGGAQVSLGANDSAGTGFKALRVPN